MLIQDTIFYMPDWRWHNFLKYLTNNLSKYNCLEKKIPSEYSYKDSTYGSKKSKKNVNLSTWGVTHKKRIQFARAVSINSPNYSVLNFLIIPNTIYNVPFFGVDFVSLPNSHLLVLDFQHSLKIENQYNNELLEKLIKLKNHCHLSLPLAEKMSADVARFFSPGVIWSKLPKEVKNFEPKVALLGGEDGLEHIRKIIQKAPLFLKENGWLILENHFDQGEKVKQLLLKNQFTSIEIVKDLSGIGRFTIGRYK